LLSARFFFASSFYVLKLSPRKKPSKASDATSATPTSIALASASAGECTLAIACDLADFGESVNRREERRDRSGLL
jgi:hypothetical protein